MAFGADGQNFVLGQINKAASMTKLTGNVSGGPALQVSNPSTASGSKALQLSVAQGRAPLTVNATAGRATNLNADKIDGKDLTQIGVNGLQRVEKESAEDSKSPKQVTATCPSGKVLVGTGFDIFGGKSGTAPDQETDVMIDFVIPGSTSVTAAAYEDRDGADETTNSIWSVKAIAICATEGTP